MNKLLFLLLTSVGLIVSSCEDNSPANSRLNVLLVDEPAGYQAVNVEVLGVEINYSSENEDHGWQSLETNTGIYDLLSLTAGNEALLVSTDIEDGTISQIRLLLGNENSVITHDGEYELKTPSGQSAGVKLSLHESFVGGIDYTVILDFDVSKSII